VAIGDQRKSLRVSSVAKETRLGELDSVILCLLFIMCDVWYIGCLYTVNSLNFCVS